MKKIISICNKCGKEQPPDKTKSNENWIAYDNTKKCECGALDWTLEIDKKHTI